MKTGTRVVAKCEITGFECLEEGNTIASEVVYAYPGDVGTVEDTYAEHPAQFEEPGHMMVRFDRMPILSTLVVEDEVVTAATMLN